MLQNCWNRDIPITNNLTNVVTDIKRWKLQNFDQVLHKKKELMDRIAGVQRSIQNGNNSGGMKRLENKLQIELSDVLKKEELMWFQRSRAKWLLDGDRNTRYYHLKTVNRRRKNNVLMLKNEQGQWVDNTEQLQNMATEFYVKLFSDDQISRGWTQTEITYPVLEAELKNRLAAPISNDEVKSVCLICIRGRLQVPTDSRQVFIKNLGRLLGKQFAILLIRFGIIRVLLLKLIKLIYVSFRRLLIRNM
jgi:hypothetical protein